jgi:endonuclease/exonuclease/phosphatase family metal-dependent hydrolase
MAFLKNAAALCLGIIGALALFSACASLIGPAGWWWWAELFALAWPFLFAVCASLLLVGVVVRRTGKLWLLVPGTIAGLFHLPAFVQLGQGPDSSLVPDRIKVLTYNVRLFDFYAWSGIADGGARIVDQIASEGADIVCLQEFSTTDTAHFSHLDSLRRRFGLPHVRTIHVDTTRSGYLWGMAIFSRHPFAGSGQVELGAPTANAIHYADVVLPNDTLRVYNVHLQSNRFKDADRYVFDDQEQFKQRFMGALARLRNATRKRADQATTLKAHMQSSPHPILLCGDLNDPPATYVYRVLGSGLCDAFLESGTGIGHTYHGPFPGARIDHILHSEQWAASGLHTVAQQISDHDPVVCHLHPVRP